MLKASKYNGGFFMGYIDTESIQEVYMSLFL